MNQMNSTVVRIVYSTVLHTVHVLVIAVVVSIVASGFSSRGESERRGRVCDGDRGSERIELRSPCRILLHSRTGAAFKSSLLVLDKVD